MSVRAGARWAASAIGAVLLVTGCGDPALWARWRAERGTYRARHVVERLERDPGLASDADWARAAAACSVVCARFPAEAWSARGRRGDALALDVLAASGEAALLRARLDELRGRGEEALGHYDRVRRDYLAVPAVSLEGAVAQARLLARAGRAEEAERLWAVVARDYPPADPRTGVVFGAVLDAPLLLARARRARGDPAGVDSMMRAAEAACLARLHAPGGGTAAPDLWMRVAEARTARGLGAGALDALRRALAAAGGEAMAPRIVLMLAQRALEDASPDTALAYAGWAAGGFDGEVRPAALLIAARAWRARGQPDSALGTYETVLEEGPDDAAEVVTARYERARLLESLGRWDQARGEYHALASATPTDPLAFEALLRVVRHHLERGERGLGLTEARHALEAVDALIASQEDDSLQVRAGQARARLLFEMDNVQGGCGSLAALLRRYPEAPLDPALLLDAARAAESRLAQPDLALELYRAAAARAGEPGLRRSAHAEVERLGRAPR